ncbi:MAG: hypothetical protein FWD38_06025 [Oscillospiraceae bacterium]|nr:hypothetical protein [Oscillospiraceae bacterium]
MTHVINPYLPIKATIEKIIQETTSPDLDVKTFRIKLLTDEPFNFMPGQFVEFPSPGLESVRLDLLPCLMKTMSLI